MTDDPRDTEPAPAPPVILVVDDDVDVRQRLAGALRHDGYEVIVTSSGEEAVQALAASPLPALVALGRRLPRMSGEEFLRVKAAYLRWARIPVVMIHGYGDAPVAGAPGNPPEWEALLDRIRLTCPIIGRGNPVGPAGD